MQEWVYVLLLRRWPDELSVEERTAIVCAFPGKTVKFVRTDPKDYEEHLADCKRIKPSVVILPLEKPIPSAAMDAGFIHCAWKSGGGLLKLKPMNPEFEPFPPQIAPQ